MTREEAKRILYVYRAVNLIDASHRGAFDLAIEALEQEPCEYAISRADVKKILYNSIRIQELSYPQIIERIDELPPVTPAEKVGKWILVSERLPKCCGMYLVTRKIYECPDTEPIIMTDESWFDGTNTWHNDNRINHDRKYLTDVIAWMPLPEPYKAERSDKKNGRTFN